MKKELVVISGYSGAGKSSVARILEDLGFFVIDNLPPQFLGNLLDLAQKNKKKLNKIALIIDVREALFLNIFPKKWQDINEQTYNKKLIFLTASKSSIIARYQETKRIHPLDTGCGIDEALAKEQELLKTIHSLASHTIKTDSLNTHELKNLIKSQFLPEYLGPKVSIISFGFKYGIPLNLDLCFDVRFLDNPYYHQTLKAKTGLEKEVYDFVINQEPAKIFFEKMLSMLLFLYPHYEEEGKSNLTIAIGCTGGKHRSVAIALALSEELGKKIKNIRVEHRDITRQS
jgi:UPF0042 nucleotide-binding protein